MLKAVIDTNVLISGVLSKSGLPAKILNLWQGRSFMIISSEEAIQEVQRVLDDLGSRGKYNLPPAEVTDLIRLLREESQSVTGQIAVSGVIPQDVTIEKFLAMAIEADADVIVSGDKHLLNLAKFRNIPILTPRQFLERLEQEGHE